MYSSDSNTIYTKYSRSSHKMKDFDTYSFQPQAHHRQQSLGSSQGQQPQIPTFRKIEAQQVLIKKPPLSWKQITYRFQKPKITTTNNYNKSYKSHINDKISRIDQELSSNIRRRIQLENKLYQEKITKQQQLNQQYFKQHYVKSDEQVGKMYKKLEKQSDQIDGNIRNMNNSNDQLISENQNKQKILKQEPLTLQHNSKVKPIFNKTTKTNFPKSNKNTPIKQPQKALPNQLKLQSLLSATTFPELPRKNLQKLQQQILQLSIHSQHSDVYYLQMIINFHLRKYLAVRKYYRQISRFKVYEKKAEWIAAEAEFQLDDFQLCIKFVDQCMQSITKRQLDDRCLPRLLYLQARCYQQIGNFINSVVCYNQLIKLRPKVAQFYLQRGIIYDKIGYPKQAKQDLTYFGILKPQAFDYLKQKILTQQNQIKKKQLIKVLAKLS